MLDNFQTRRHQCILGTLNQSCQGQGRSGRSGTGLFHASASEAYETPQSRRRALDRSRPDSAKFRADEEAGRG